MIREKIKEKGLSQAEVSRRLDVAPPVFNTYLLMESLQFGILWKISLAIEYNFLAEIMAALPENVLQSSASAFQVTIKEQEAVIADLRKEVEIYKNLLVRNLK